MKKKFVDLMINMIIGIKIKIIKLKEERKEQIKGVTKTAVIMINIMIIEKIHEKLVIKNIGEKANHQVPLNVQDHQDFVNVQDHQNSVNVQDHQVHVNVQDHQVPVNVQNHQSQKSNYVIFLKNEL